MKSMKSIIRKYNKLEDINEHTLCAILLAENFGTKEEVEELKKIHEAHIDRGYITYDEIEARRQISNKYYPSLHKKEA
jgi:phage antirepressor YoqD-like protein